MRTAGVNLWAGQAHELALDLPAAVLVTRLGTDARTALTGLPESGSARTPPPPWALLPTPSRLA